MIFSRPLVYVSLRKRFGGTSWVPWLSSCILDLLSIRLSSAAMQGCQKNDVEVSTTDVNTSKQSEIQRRYMVLLMYFMKKREKVLPMITVKNTKIFCLFKNSVK